MGADATAPGIEIDFRLGLPSRRSLRMNRQRLLEKTVSILLVLLVAHASCMAPKRAAGLAPERSIPPSPATSLSRLVAQEDPPGASVSGFAVLDTNRSAYLARLDLWELAEKTLDIQYYIWDDDLTGRLFIDQAALCARRGVRVRILLDDFPGARKDSLFRALARQPNVQVRLFNPFGSRRLPRARRWAEFLLRFETLNHRMHNKLMVADGALAVIGGRNIGDPYFGVARKRYNHRDFDLLCAGPIVGDMSGNFDEFWNSALAFPVESLHSVSMSDHRAAQVWAGLEREVAASTVPAYLRRPPLAREDREKALLAEMVWAPGKLVADGPEKVAGGDKELFLNAIRDFGEQAHHDLVVVTPYYATLGKQATEAALDAGAREGLRIRMLVNSLASIDGPWSDVGYARARRSLLRHGVELYEAKPNAACRNIHTDMRDPAMRLVLHSKVAVVDRRLIFTGTMNLDPRSIHLNTEAGVLVDSPELAEKILEAVEVDFQPENSWRVELGSQCGGDRPPGLSPDDLVWITETEHGAEFRRHEPSGTLWRRLARFFFKLFPIGGLI